MTEEANDVNTITVPERLRKILDILTTYKRNIIQSLTLSSQDPQETLSNTKRILAKHGDVIKDYISWKIIPEEAKEDKELMECLKELTPYLHPWNAQISVLGPRWCILMFKDYPMTILPEHIQEIYNNSGADVDGLVEEEPVS